MPDLKTTLETALLNALQTLDVTHNDAPIQEVPADKPGDYGSPVAFGLAKTLRKNPALIAKDILAGLELPEGIARAEAVGPYINFFVDPGLFVKSVIQNEAQPPQRDKKVIVEHTSINPNKEAHVAIYETFVWVTPSRGFIRRRGIPLKFKIILTIRAVRRLKRSLLWIILELSMMVQKSTTTG